MTLTQALEVLEAKHKAKLSMIEFEDGSGYKFNYRIFGEDKNKFVDLLADDFAIQYQQVTSIIGKW
jgi:hypothetical protein